MSFSTTRRRAAPSATGLVIPYTQIATSFVWQKAPSTVNIGSFGLTDYVLGVVLDQKGAAMLVQPSITYGSGTPANLSISGNVLTSVANGTSLITATTAGFANLTGTATSQQIVASITGVTSPLNTTDLSSGTFTPVAKDSTSHTIIAATFTYTSLIPSIISVNSSGAWTGQSAGSTTINIVSGPITFPVSCVVTHATYTPIPTTVVITTGSVFACNVSSSIQLGAVTYDQFRVPMTGRTYTWVSSNTGLATVGAGTGLVSTGINPSNNTMTISATDVGASLVGSVNFTVGLQLPMTVTVGTVPYGFGLTIGTACPFISLAPGATQQLYVMSYDWWNTPMVQDTTFTWSSDETGAASVNSSGLVTGVANGGATISVSDNTTPQLIAIAQAGVGLYLEPYAMTASPGANVQFAMSNSGTDVTSSTTFNTSNVTLGTVGTSAPTLTGAPSPSSITQNTGPITTTLPCTNPHASQILGGLTAGLSAGPITVISSTSVSFPITATAGATVGTASLFLIDPAQGPSNTESLTVASGASLPVTGLVRRYTGSSGTSTTTNGASVSTWTDTIAGKVLTATGGNAAGFTYLASAIGGKPGVQLAPISDTAIMIESAYDSTINPSSSSIVLVLENTGGARTSGIAGTSTTGVPSHTGYTIDLDEAGHTLIGHFGTGTSADSVGGTLSASAGHTVLLELTNAASVLYIDNVSQATSSSNYSPATSVAFGLFNYDTLLTNGFQGVICEALIYDHVLSPTERTALAAWVNSVYGI